MLKHDTHVPIDTLPIQFKMDEPIRSNGRELSEDANQREVRFEHSTNFPELLTELGLTILITTYQAGKIVLLGAQQQQLALSFHNFDRPMGIALNHGRSTLAVAAKNKIWFLRNASDIANRMDPPVDACFLTRTAHVTGEIQAHEMGWVDDELWIVNTLFSCLCTLDPNYSFVPRWQPSFISDLAPEDRCHLNGLAMEAGSPKYVTVMGETDRAGGWREDKVRTGSLIDIGSSEVVARGFAMPHSPRVHNQQIWLLDSGGGGLVRIDPSNGKAETVARFPGYTRGLAIHGRYGFIGLSRIRETSTFGGVPIAENRDRLKCGVAVVDLERSELLGQFEFKTGVEEVFDVSLIPDKPLTAMRGPFSQEDGKSAIWTVPSGQTGKTTPALGI